MAEDHSSLTVLLVEDNPGDVRLIEHYLQAPNVSDVLDEVTLTHVETLADALARLDAETYDVVFLDLGLQETTGLTTLERILEAEAGIPIIVLTGLDDRETAVEAIGHGAQDYLPKDDLDPNRLSRALRYAVERHRQEEELKRQNERLERFAGVVSHDLRNPLSIAQMYLEEVRKETDTEAVEKIDANLQRMEVMIKEVLRLAKEGKPVADTESVQIGHLARECWRTVATDEAQIEVTTESVIEGDENRLRHLFENLFRNAIEHGTEAADGDSADDTSATDLTVRVGELDRGFFVEDDGPGIPAGDRDSVFEAGFTTDRRGTGFGLNIVAEIAAAHGWTVEVTESAAGGARFEFRERPGA